MLSHLEIQIQKKLTNANVKHCIKYKYKCTTAPCDHLLHQGVAGLAAIAHQYINICKNKYNIIKDGVFVLVEIHQRIPCEKLSNALQLGGLDTITGENTKECTSTYFTCKSLFSTQFDWRQNRYGQVLDLGID